MEGIDSSQIRPVTFQPGDILFKENDRSFHFYIIQEGWVEIYKTSENGTVIPLAEAGEGTSIGEFAMIDHFPRSATARAKTVVHAVEVSEVAYRKLLSDLPDWAVAVMRGLVERLRNANEIIRKASTYDAQVSKQIASAEYDPDTSEKAKILLEEFDDTPDLK